MHSCVTLLSQKLLHDNPVALRFSLVVLCPLLSFNISFSALLSLSIAIFTLDFSTGNPAASCLFAVKVSLPRYSLVFLLPTARRSFLASHLLLSLLAASQLPLPSTKQLQFSIAASKCCTISWLQLTNIPQSIGLAVRPEVKREELLVSVAQPVSQTAAQGPCFEADLPRGAWASDAAPA